MIAGAVDLVMAHHRDLIVVGGDYVTNRDHRFVQPAADALARLSAPFGVFAVLGNHDDERETRAALTEAGFVVLKDARSTGSASATNPWISPACATGRTGCRT